MGRQGTPRTDASRASLAHRVGAYVSAHRLRRRWLALMGVLAAVVVVVTAGALTMPASTMTADVATLPEGASVPEGYTQQYTAKDEANGIIVTAYAPEGVVPEGATLKASLLAQDSDEYVAAKQATGATDEEGAGFAAMDISFVDVDGNEVEPTGDVYVNIDAAGILPEDADPESVVVQHLAEDESGAVASVDTVADAADVTEGIAAVDTNDATSIQAAFNANGFSTFAITWRGLESSSGDESQPSDATNESTGSALAVPLAEGDANASDNDVEVEGSIMTEQQEMAELLNHKENSWQVVKEDYEHRTTNYSDDGNVRVQKSVISTDVENEFYVYMNVDVKMKYENYFEQAVYEATTSNNYHDEPLGSVVTSMTGNEHVSVTGDPAANYSNSALFTIQDPDGNVLAKDVRIYWSQAENVTFYIRVDDAGVTKYILLGVKVKSGDQTPVIKLSDEAYELIKGDAVASVGLTSVKDTMGSYINFDSVVGGDYAVEPTCEDGILNWTPVVKDNPTLETTTKDDGTEETWALNAAELVYKVKLDVSKLGFDSAADHMTDDVDATDVNSNAFLSYEGANGSGSVDFPVPGVRGLLYDIKFDKVDEDDTTKKLSGAEFTLTDNSGKVYKVEDDGGTYTATGLPWGTYTLTETKAPSGYQIGEQGSWTFTLCYTTDKGDLINPNDTLGVSSEDMLYKHNDVEAVWQITNKFSVVGLQLIKVESGSNDVRLSGAEFRLYRDGGAAGSKEYYSGTDESGFATWSQDSQGAISAKTDPNGEILFDGLPSSGTYFLEEIAAPAGYEKLSNPVTVDIEGGKIKTATIAGTPIDSHSDESQTAVVSVTVPNSTGAKLPETGGCGTTIGTIGGVILVAAAVCGYGLRRRHEGRGARS